MAVFKGELEEFYASADESEKRKCEVNIGNGKIIVSYYHDGHILYEGTELAPGHFKLICPSLRARATLHSMPDEPDILEGFWTEESVQGMWRIYLDTQ